MPYIGEGYIQQNLERVFSYIEELNLKVSNNASKKLKEMKAEFDNKYKDGSNLEAPDGKALFEEINVLQRVILAEAEELSAFFPDERRYNTDLLFEDISGIFGRETFARLPENARNDFQEAGMCLVLGRGTAAAYHLMRGSECCLKQLYFSVIKQKRLDKPMWGPMVKALEGRKALDDALSGTLDNFRSGFRNPVAHPDKFYTIDEAQDLLGTTTQLVSLIANHNKYAPPK